MTQSSPSQVGPQRLLVTMLVVVTSSFSMSSTSASTVAWSCRRQLKEPYTPSLRKNIVSSFLPGCSSSRGCEYICKSDAESPTDDVDGESVGGAGEVSPWLGNQPQLAPFKYLKHIISSCCHENILKIFTNIYNCEPKFSARLSLILLLISRKLTSASAVPGKPPPMSSSCRRTPSLSAARKTARAAVMARLKAADSRQPEPTWKLEVSL